MYNYCYYIYNNTLNKNILQTKLSRSLISKNTVHEKSLYFLIYSLKHGVHAFS